MRRGLNVGGRILTLPPIANRAIGSRWRDCARHPSHTTGRAVFRIRRLNAAALPGRKV